MLKCGYKSLYKDRANVYKWLKRIIKRDSVQYIINQSPDADEQEVDEKIDEKIDEKFQDINLKEKDDKIDEKYKGKHRVDKRAVNKAK